MEPKALEKHRRFQPPRRKERPKAGTGPAAAPPTPVPPAPDAALAPSAEMAWLLRASERFDQEAAEAPVAPAPASTLSHTCQVHCFLVQNGLDQYVAVFVCNAFCLWCDEQLGA